MKYIPSFLFNAIIYFPHIFFLLSISQPHLFSLLPPSSCVCVCAWKARAVRDIALEAAQLWMESLAHTAHAMCEKKLSESQVWIEIMRCDVIDGWSRDLESD